MDGTTPIVPVNYRLLDHHLDRAHQILTPDDRITLIYSLVIGSQMEKLQ